MLPFFTGPRPRRRCAVVGNFTSVVSWIASTCRPAIAAPVSLLQPSTIFAAVTFGLAKNRPACSSPPRLTPSRPTGHVRGQAPTYRLARDHPFEDRPPPLSRRRSPNDPSDHSISAPVLRLPGQTESYPRRVGQGISQINTTSNITCAHALAHSQGQAVAGGGFEQCYNAQAVVAVPRLRRGRLGSSGQRQTAASADAEQGHCAA